jgi:hypothetical protein
VSWRLLAGIVVAFGVAAATVVVVWVALGGDATSAQPSETPSHFVSRTVATLGRDDYSGAWALLYPPHQQVAPRDEYVACETKTPLHWKIRSMRVVRVSDRTVHVPGDTEDVAAKAVTLRLRVFETSIGTEEAFSHTFTAVPVDDEWTWILTPSQYQRYRTHSCGT